MNPLIQFKKTTPLFATVLLLLACFIMRSTPNAFGVVPPPDGGYPGFNTAEGQSALLNLTTGAGNTAVGWRALFSDSTANFNTAVGVGTLLTNNADSNTAIGVGALLFNTDGHSNTAVGVRALERNDHGFGNTAIGIFALASNLTGFGNTAIGFSAGADLTLGGGNVCIGLGVIGDGTESSTTRIRNIGSTAIVGGTSVVVEGTGGIGDQRLGFASSSRRYKDEIKPMDKASEALFALKPVTFRAKGNANSSHVKHYGLIAEDVAAVDPDLVVYNPEGRPEALRRDSINAMLLNEFLKARRQIDAQQKQIEALSAGLQKVTAQLAMASPSLADSR